MLTAIATYTSATSMRKTTTPCTTPRCSWPSNALGRGCIMRGAQVGQGGEPRLLSWERQRMDFGQTPKLTRLRVLHRKVELTGASRLTAVERPENREISGCPPGALSPDVLSLQHKSRA